MKKIKTALISVFDKAGVIELAEGLSRSGIKIISTGGTAALLEKSGISVVTVEEINGFPEILDGRVKTLHPNIHAGILANRTKKHLNELKKHKINTIDMVVVNFYPFEAEPCAENIDIGGVAMLRAAAKNYRNVLPVCDNNDYKDILSGIKKKTIGIELRKKLAAKAFTATSYYDAVISNGFSFGEKFPQKMVLAMKKTSDLRYGENPHQKAAIYKEGRGNREEGSIKQLQGKELSYNNYLDLNSAFNLACELREPCCVIVKHGSPCGVCISTDILDSYKNALLCDPVSSFGGIVAFNIPVEEKTASEIIKIFTECIIAPGYSNRALKIFSQKGNLRILESKLRSGKYCSGLQFYSVTDGILAQEKDNRAIGKMKLVSKKVPTKKELKSLKFAFTVAKYVKSNAIVLAKNSQTVGIGAGQMSRIDSFKVALSKMKSAKLPLSINKAPLMLASDAFFPFRDIVQEAAKAGVKAIIQPGGSIRDDESIKACGDLGIAMVFTGIRHFRH